MTAPIETPPDVELRLVKVDGLLAGVTISAEHAEELIQRYLTMCVPSADRTTYEEQAGQSDAYRYYPCPPHPDGYVRVHIDIRRPWTPDSEWPMPREAQA